MWMLAHSRLQQWHSLHCLPSSKTAQALSERCMQSSYIKSFPHTVSSLLLFWLFHLLIPPVLILSHMNSVHTFPFYFFKIHFNFYFFKIHFNIIHPSVSGFSKWPVSFRFSNQFLIYSHMCYMLHKAHPPGMFLPNLMCVTN